MVIVQKGSVNRGSCIVQSVVSFDLPYWKYLKLRHNLDIEKNVCDNVVGTLFNIDGKTKDTVNSRLDLGDMCIRSDLHAYKK